MRPLSMRHALTALNAAIIALVLAAIALVPTGPFVAVVMPPGTSVEATARAVAAAGGMLVAPARVGWIVIARSDARAFPERLREAGAWLTLNPRAVSICAPLL